MSITRFASLKLLRNLTFLVFTTYLLSSCAATSLAISKKNLDVQTKINRTLWLNPVPDQQKTIYLNFRNTSDKTSFNQQSVNTSLKNMVITRLQQKGYKIIQSAYKAHYWLQVNILKIGRTTTTAAEKAGETGPGSSLEGALVGGAAGALIAPNRPRAWLGAGLAGAAVSLVANSAVKDVIYVAITDIRVSERQAPKRYKHYNRRIVSTAEKVNLKFAEAFPALENGLANVIGGLF